MEQPKPPINVPFGGGRGIIVGKVRRLVSTNSCAKLAESASTRPDQLPNSCNHDLSDSKIRTATPKSATPAQPYFARVSPERETIAANAAPEMIRQGPREPSLIASIRREPLLQEIAAAKLLGLSVGTLRNWRSQRRGPPWIKMGRSVRYGIADLEKYLAACRRTTGAAETRNV
jgi:predicted DNA-binding transcriptional regulator AlpA